MNYAGVIFDYTAAKKSFDAAARCVFGTEPVHMSLLYFLTYISAAGSMDTMLSSRANFGAQEFRVVVWMFVWHIKFICNTLRDFKSEINWLYCFQQMSLRFTELYRTVNFMMYFLLYTVSQKSDTLKHVVLTTCTEFSVLNLHKC